MNPGYSEMLGRAGRLVGDNRLADALLVLLQAVRINRQGVQALVDLGEVWLKLGHTDQARSCWTEALRWGPSEGARVGLGRLCLKTGDPERASVFAGEALRSSPTSPRALILQAEIAHFRGDAAGARAAALEAESVFEAELDHWEQFDRLLLNLGETAAARRVFDRCAERIPVSGRKHLAEIAFACADRDHQRLEKGIAAAKLWDAWQADDLKEGLCRIPDSEATADFLRWLALRYCAALAQKITGQGGSGWPKRTAGSALRVGLISANWSPPVAARVARLLSSAPEEQIEATIYCLDDTPESASESAVEEPIKVARLGSVPAPNLARYIVEEDCDVLLADRQAPGSKVLEVVAHRPAELAFGWGPGARWGLDFVIDAAEGSDYHPPDWLLKEVERGEVSAESWRELTAERDRSTGRRGQGGRTAGELRALWQQALHWHRAGEAQRADLAYTAILSDQGEVPSVLYMRGALRRDQGSQTAAAADFWTAVRGMPGFANAAVALLEIQNEIGAYPDAVATGDKALSVTDEDSRLWRLYGIAQARAGAIREAADALDRATILAPGDAANWFHRAMFLHASGQDELAIDALQKAAVIDPTSAEAFFNLGALYQHSEQPDRAAQCFEQALRLGSGDAQVFKSLGDTLFAARKYRAWIENFVRFESTSPQAFPLAVYGLEIALFTGDWGRLERYFRGVIQEKFPPRDSAELIDGLEEILYLMLFMDWEVSEIGDLYRAYSSAAERFYGSPRATVQERRPGRIRIGYLSGDVRDHVMGKMVFQWLSHHDRGRFETYLYSTRPRIGEWGARISAAAEYHRPLETLADGAAIASIAADDLDILIDCSTHTKGARQAILAAKPARVQLTSIASAGCLGMNTIDFKLTDAIADLPVMQEHQVEPLLAAPGCIYPYRHVPPAEFHSYQREGLGIPSGALVLGAFVSIFKLSRRCLAIWREILQRLPHAVIALSPTDLGQREAYVRVFKAAGIGADRLCFVPQGRDEHENQARYFLVDVVLDPMPFGGANGTIEALDMGIPVVTLCGRRHGERVATSILTNLGVLETIAHSGPEYVDIACRLASDREFSESVRRDLREGIGSSAFTNLTAHVRGLEQAYLTALGEKFPRLFQAEAR